MQTSEGRGGPSAKASGVPAEVRDALLGCDLEDASELFSIDTWHKLTERERAELSTLLPSCDPLSREDVIRSLFSAEPLHFGAPLMRFWVAMQAGQLSDEMMAAAAQEEETHRQEHRSFQRRYHNDMVHRLHYMKRTYTPPAPAPPPSRTKSSTSHSTESLMYSKEKGGLLRKKGVPGRKGGLDDGTESPGKAKSPRSSTGASSKTGAKSKAAKVAQPATMPPPSWEGGEQSYEWQMGASEEDGEESIAELSSMDECDNDDVEEEASELVMSGEHAAQQQALVMRSNAVAASTLPMTAPQEVPMAASPAGNRGDVGNAVMIPSDSGGFFLLVRDILTSVPHGISPICHLPQQVQAEAERHGMGSRLPPGVSLGLHIHSVLLFMSAPGGLIAIDESLQAYRWVAPPHLSTNEVLLRLEAMHYERSLVQHGMMPG